MTTQDHIGSWTGRVIGRHLPLPTTASDSWSLRAELRACPVGT